MTFLRSLLTRFQGQSRRMQIIVSATALVGLCVCCGIIAAIGNTGNGTTTANIHTSGTTRATVTVKPKPTATPFALKGLDGPLATGGQAVLGGTLDAFIAKYGVPHVRTQLTVGFDTTCSSGAADCEQVGLFPSMNGKYFVDTVSFSTPDSQPWASLGVAKAACRIGFPSDAQLKSEGPDVQAGQTIGYYAVYTSASLVKVFAASVFTDAQGNATTPGTFDVLMLSAPNGGYSDCQIAAGASGA